MKPHPSLSDVINLNILQSLKDGGLYVEKVQPENTLYTLQRLLDGSGWMIQGNPHLLCPNLTLCNIHGSTWGGSMIKVGFIGIGMRMEIGLIYPNGMPDIITTSTVRSIQVG